MLTICTPPFNYAERLGVGKALGQYATLTLIIGQRMHADPLTVLLGIAIGSVASGLAALLMVTVLRSKDGQR